MEAAKLKTERRARPALDGGTAFVAARVSRFLKHPSGHTVYECEVELPSSRQLWAVFKRYRDFVDLRQELKISRQQQQQQQQQHQQASSAAGRGKPHTPAKRSLASRAGPVRGSGVAAAGRGEGGRRGRGGLASPDRPAESIAALLASYKFPNKLAFGGSDALRQERRKALNNFLVAAVQLRPLPQSVAAFLGLLKDNRLSVDQHGNYVRVMRTEDIVPMLGSPGYSRPRARKKKSDKNGLPTAATATATAAAVAAIPPPARETPGGRNTPPKAGESAHTTKDTNAPLLTPPPTPSPTAAASTEAAGASGAMRRPPPPSVGARSWDGVRTVEMAVSIGAGEMEWSDTDEPTDSESGSDLEGGEPESGKRDPHATGSEQEKTGAVRPESSPVAGREERGRGYLSPGVAGQRGAEGDVPTGGTTRPAGESVVSEPIVSESLVSESVVSERVAAAGHRGVASPPLPVARLRGGGGGGGRDSEGREAEGKDEGVSEGWSLDQVEEERMIQWEFVSGYIEEVVFRVVGRQDLEDGIGVEANGSGSGGGGGAGSKGGARGGDGLHPSVRPSAEERNVRMAELQSLGVDLPNETLLLLLRYTDWGPETATALYQDLVAAGRGLLEKVTPGEPVRGMANGGNTCYIDSLLFAMFATIDAFDWLLLKPLPPTDPPEVKLLQKHVRFLVNQLRRGFIVPRDHSNLIRAQLLTCGWQGGTSSQEDVSELFTFLVCLLRCPALPLSEALFHGGKSDASDSRISTERALYLALPEEKKPDPSPPPPKTLSPARGAGAAKDRTSSFLPTAAAAGSAAPPRPNRKHDRSGEVSAGASRAGTAAAVAAAGAGSAAVTLEQILMHNFHNNRVEGLQRSVSGEKGSQPVNAWRMVSMLPFYAFSGELAGDSDPSNDRHFDTIMLPMVLKRYEAEEPHSPAGAAATSGGGTVGAAVAAPKKSRRKVLVPHRLDCSKFMAPAGGGKGGAAEYARFVLVLKSAVCHLGGESISKGHYVAYSADRSSSDGGTSSASSAAALDRPTSTTAAAASGREKETLGSSAAGGRSVDCSQDSVSWLRLDDLKKGPAGSGFVERLESVHDANRLFSEDLGLHSYMLFYELVPLNLDDADKKAQMKEKCALIETQPDYELALQLELQESVTAGLQAAGAAARGGAGANMCFVS